MAQKSYQNHRIETDAIGPVQVPKEAYYGSLTARALANFKISGRTAPAVFRRALGMIKLAACQANTALGLIGEKESKVIQTAAREFIDGKFDDQFQLDLFQAGAGTPYNMNANEVIANCANELLGKPKGTYSPVHPNNHVNMAQSSNDVIPTAVRLATLMAIQGLKVEMDALAHSLEKKGRTYARLVKVGRTHLQDAVPVTLGQEFMAYASAIRTAMTTLKEAETALCVLGIGGTATGTGITTHPHFQKTIVSHLSKLSGFKLKPASNLIETTHSMAALLKASSALRTLAVEVNRIANDIRLMVSGPLAGINELHIPEVEPGSSIMPGKVNPSVPECLNMICFQVIANDQAVSLGAQGGQLELNWFTPLILKNLTESIEILTNGLKMFRTDCIDHVHANEPRIRQLFEGSLVTATALAPYLGYHQVAMLVNEALAKKKPLKEVVRAHKLMSDADLERLLRPEAMVKPAAAIDTALRNRLQKK